MLSTLRSHRKPLPPASDRRHPFRRDGWLRLESLDELLRAKGMQARTLIVFLYRERIEKVQTLGVPQH